jgi:uncharacterized protein (DUF1800 family)
MSLTGAYIAATRFGFGARVGELAIVADDPRGWLKSQLSDSYTPKHDFFSELLPTYKVADSYNRLLRSDLDHMRERFVQFGENIYEEEVYARTAEAVTTSRPFYERLVEFWSNHFAVSSITTEVKSYRMKGYVGAYERDAIRLHVLGKFSDMLLASARHPAMLIYLDNDLSSGNNSDKAKREGLNENHAREILELHTLGVDGGYAQTDVIALANIISGWSVDLSPNKSANGFVFRGWKHEPGEKILLGKTYPAAEARQGVYALKDLAKHPSTAKFIALKLAKHFVADKPSPSLVKKLETCFIETDGDLKALAFALVDSDEAWQTETWRIKQPNHYIISAVRAVSKADDIHSKDVILEGLTYLGQYPFKVTSPEGFSADSHMWQGAEAMMRRVEWARQASKAFTTDARPYDIAKSVMGPVMSDSTGAAIKAASNNPEGLAMLFASPEFQVR